MPTTLINDSEEQRDLFTSILLVFGIIYLAQTGFVGWFLIDWRSMDSAIYFLGFELIFIGIAYDITESVFAIFAQPRKTPFLVNLTEFPPVALLMTICDDARPERWATLRQNYPNCDIFILDDSKTHEQQELIDQSGHRVVRRQDKRAFKAGNLNNWFNKYGEKYKYFAILDSDSLVTPDFVENLVAFAEHPANQQIAIFQSYIFPIDAETVFSKVLGSMTQLRFYIFERFSNRAGLMLSWGHNQLIRTDVVSQVGGFCETISPEDTTLSLLLDQKGFSIRLVNVVSYDTDPPDVISFTRRVARWAGQTAEIFSLPWNGASFRLKSLICYHLYSYTIHNVYITLLILTAWGYDSRGISPLHLLQFIIRSNHEIWLWTLVIAEMTILWCAQFFCGFTLASAWEFPSKLFFHICF